MAGGFHAAARFGAGYVGAPGAEEQALGWRGMVSRPTTHANRCLTSARVRARSRSRRRIQTRRRPCGSGGSSGYLVIW